MAILRRVDTMAIVRRAESGGIKAGPLPEDTARTAILIAMLTLAIYMAGIVDLKVFSTFKRRNTLYFWSILITSWGIMSHSLGIILKWFVSRRHCPWEVNTAFASFGWWGMVTGQSLVLYSRLHLVVRDDRVLRAIFIMIILDFCIFQVPTTILTFGSNRPNPGMWLTVYNIYERIQLIVFTLQEFIISVVYIRAAIKMLLPNDPAETRKTKKFLIYTNVLCIVLDIAFVCEVYSGEWVYKTGTQSLAYAIKLTIEFLVLNKLMDVYRLGPGTCSACRRKLDSSRRAYAKSGGGGTDSHRPSNINIARGSSSIMASPGWRGKPRGLERLGPFEEEMGNITSVEGDDKAAHAYSRPMVEGNEAGNKDIVITTGITTMTAANPQSTPNTNKPLPS